MSHSDTTTTSPTESNYVYPQAIVLIVLSLITAILNIGPFLWHLKARNIPACCIIFWIILLNVFSFVNASIWGNDNTDTWFSGVGYCDVESKLLLAANVGTCGAVLCVLRSLAMVLDTKNTVLSASDSQKRRDKIIMIVFCFAFPIYIMAVHYIVQPIRYLLYGIVGCVPLVDSSWLSDFLVLIWPVILTLADAVYAILIIVRMQRYRSEFSRLLTISNTTKSRFVRLFALSAIFVLTLVPLQVFSYYTNHHGSPYHKYSFSTIHGPAWYIIYRIPSAGVVPLDRWIYVVMGGLVFAFFGTGADAIGMYRGWLVKLGLVKPASRGAAPRSSFLGRKWTDLGGKAKSLLSRSSTAPVKGAEMESFDRTSLSSGATASASHQNCHTHSAATGSIISNDEVISAKEFWATGKGSHDMV